MTRIEQPIEPDRLPNFAHPANIVQCMANGHQPTESDGGEVMIEVPITVWPLGRTKKQIGALRLCVICGTAYGVL